RRRPARRSGGRSRRLCARRLPSLRDPGAAAGDELEARRRHVLRDLSPEPSASRTVSPLFHTNRATFDAFGRNHRLIAARRTIDELRGQPEDSWNVFDHTAMIYV